MISATLPALGGTMNSSTNQSLMTMTSSDTYKDRCAALLRKHRRARRQGRIVFYNIDEMKMLDDAREDRRQATLLPGAELQRRFFEEVRRR